MSDVSFRTARISDADAIARVVTDAFEGYRSFAPAGWEPPGAVQEIAEGTPSKLLDPGFWCAVAEVGGEVVGHAACSPAADALVPADDSGLAQLRALFVDREWWGHGVAGELHRMAMSEMASRGFSRVRLFTPADQARARRFYEREGWSAAGEPAESPLGLELVEYRRSLP